MGALSIAFKEVAGNRTTSVAAINGSIDANTVGAFQKELEGARHSGRIHLILDLSEVKYVNSTGLGSLVKEQDLFKSTGGTIVLLKVPAKVKIVIEMLGLHTFFNMYDSLPEAIGSMGGEAGVAPTESERLTSAESVPTTKTQRLKFDAGAAKISTPSAKTPVPKQPAKSAKSKKPVSKKAPAPAAPAKVEASDTIPCSVCNATLECPEEGTFKCPRCSTLFQVEAGGSVKFFSSEEPVPVQMSLPSTPECADGLFEFVGVMAKKLSFGGPAVKNFQRSVMDICDKIRTEAYGNTNDTPQMFHVMISVNGNSIQLTFSDHGKALGNQAVASMGGVKKGVDSLDVTNHPAGGNIITIAKSF